MSIRNVIELVLLAALWGASFLFMRIATPEFGVIVLIELRVLLASIVLMPIWYFSRTGSSSANVKAHWKPLLVVGALNSAIPFILFAYSTLYITGGYASILNATAPLWGALVAWIWLKRPPSRQAAMGLIFGLLGVVLLVSNSLSFSLSGVSLGICAGLFASFLYGVAANYTAVKLADVSPLSIATFSQVAAAILLFVPAILVYPEQSISILAWCAVIALGVLCTSAAYTLYFRLIANVGSTKAITVTFLIPVFGIFWGAVFLDEAITVEMVIGTIIILLGTSLVIGLYSSKKRIID